MLKLELFKIQLRKHTFLVFLVQYSVILSWLLIFATSISNRYPNEATYSRGIFSLFAASSVLFGVCLVRKTDMHSYPICIWSLISPIVTVFLIFASELWFLIAVCLLGGLYGIFLLSFLIRFGELTILMARGRVGGFIGFTSILVMLSLTVISAVLGFLSSVVLASLLSLCPIFATVLGRKDQAKPKVEEASSYRIDCCRSRDFFLYLMPWLI